PPATPAAPAFPPSATRRPTVVPAKPPSRLHVCEPPADAPPFGSASLHELRSHVLRVSCTTPPLDIANTAALAADRSSPPAPSSPGCDPQPHSRPTTSGSLPASALAQHPPTALSPSRPSAQPAPTPAAAPAQHCHPGRPHSRQTQCSRSLPPYTPPPQAASSASS